MFTGRRTAFFLFFLSGFCSLLYQVVWIRLAFSHFGIITPVLSVVISLFMLGLSVGSWAGGAWIARAERTVPAIYVYAIVEGLIGVGAFVVPRLFSLGETLLLPGGDMNSAAYLILSALIIALSILPWCLLMGATFPLMMAFIKSQQGSSSTSFSFLYLANVMGAMCGTIVTACILVELLGFRHTLLLAGCVNFLIAAVGVALGIRFPHADRAPERGASERAASAVDSTWWTYWILFITGFTSMSLEVIWVRDFTPVIGTTVYAFALIVAVYLLATWLGSTAYRRHAARQSALSVAALVAALSVASLFTIAIADPRLGLSYAGVVAGIFPFSILLGYLTPCLIDHHSQGNPDRAGTAYAVNVVGCILGPLLASYLFLPWLGVKASMILMALPYVVLLAMNYRHSSSRWQLGAGILSLSLLLLACFVNRSYEERYAGAIVRRDSTATVISYGEGMEKRLLVNGVGITNLTTITKVMAHLPLVLLHQKPREALVICLGMGTTYRSLLAWDGLQVTAVELVPSVKDAVGYYQDDDASNILDNPRGRVVIDDGRRFLARTSQVFDVITIDPPPPTEAAGSSLLYAEDFYALVKRRLRPSGILQQWFPGGPGVDRQAVLRSVMDSFPYVKVFASTEGWGIHILASMEPIEVPTVEDALARLPPPATRDLLAWEPGVTARSFLTRQFARQISPAVVMDGAGEASISDDRPFNEYYLLREAWALYQRVRTQRG